MNHGRVFVLMKSAVSWMLEPSLSLGGSLTLIERGIVLCLSASTTLIMPAQPATAFRWPIWLLIEPTAHALAPRVGSPGVALAHHVLERGELDGVAHGRARAVALDERDVAGSMPACSYARRMHCSCPSMVGA